MILWVIRILVLETEDSGSSMMRAVFRKETVLLPGKGDLLPLLKIPDHHSRINRR
jgi:hypothetical protein